MSNNTYKRNAALLQITKVDEENDYDHEHDSTHGHGGLSIPSSDRSSRTFNRSLGPSFISFNNERNPTSSLLSLPFTDTTNATRTHAILATESIPPLKIPASQGEPTTRPKTDSARYHAASDMMERDIKERQDTLSDAIITDPSEESIMDFEISLRTTRNSSSLSETSNETHARSSRNRKRRHRKGRNRKVAHTKRGRPTRRGMQRGRGGRFATRGRGRGRGRRNPNPTNLSSGRKKARRHKPDNTRALIRHCLEGSVQQEFQGDKMMAALKEAVEEIRQYRKEDLDRYEETARRLSDLESIVRKKPSDASQSRWKKPGEGRKYGSEEDETCCYCCCC